MHAFDPCTLAPLHPCLSSDLLAATRRLCEEERVRRLIPLAKRSFPVGMGPATRVMQRARGLFPVAEVLRRAPLRKASASRLTNQSLRVAANLFIFRPRLMAHSPKPGATPPKKNLHESVIFSHIQSPERGIAVAVGFWVLKNEDPPADESDPSMSPRVEGLRGRGFRSAGTGSWRGSGGNHFHQWLIHQHIYIGK